MGNEAPVYVEVSEGVFVPQGDVVDSALAIATIPVAMVLIGLPILCIINVFQGCYYATLGEWRKAWIAYWRPWVVIGSPFLLMFLCVLLYSLLTGWSPMMP